MVMRLMDGGCKVLAAIAALAGFGMVAVVCAGVVMRYVFQSPLAFTEELVGLLLCTMLFLALPHITLSNQHVHITMVTNWLSPVGKRISAVLSHGVVIAFSVWMMSEAIPWLGFAIRLNLKSENARLLLSPWMAVVPVSLGVVTLLAVIAALRVALRRETPDGNQ